MSNAARRDAPPGICQRISDSGHLMRRTGRAGLAAAMSLAIACPCTAAAQTALAPRDIYRISAPAVVTIETPTGIGSGVIVDPAGVVVSNLHVVDDSSHAVVTLAN